MSKKILFTLLLFIGVAGVSAKKVKLTIDGTAYSSSCRLYLIVNEDTANAQLLNVQDGKFSVTLKVESDAFVRIHDYKQWPERSPFVLIPDSKHITIDWRNGEISGSESSKKLKDVMDMIKRESPEGFHIDVFSEDKEAWARAREQAQRIRMQMEMAQREMIMTLIRDNADNNFPAWIYFCYNHLINISPESLTGDQNPKWLHHKVMDVLRSRK